MRFLFVVPPLTGHINPTVGVGEELRRRGHDVAWVGHPATLEALLPEQATVFPALDDRLEADIRRARLRWLELKGFAVLKFLWEEFLIPLAHAMIPGVQDAVKEYQPDVLIADQQALAGPVVARELGIPWVTSASTPAELIRPLRTIPKVEQWVLGQLRSLSDVDPRFSEILVLVFSSPALVGGCFPPNHVFTGPVLEHRPERGDFPWDWLAEGTRKVLVSLGTLNGPAGRRFFGEVAHAVTDMPDVQVVMVAPPLDAPPNVLVVDRVPQLALMKHMDAVVSHGGHNTVCETLGHGLPLVVAPIRDDQPIIAEQVVSAGAGVRLKYQRVRAPEIRTALRNVLQDPVYAVNARRIQESFRLGGGARTAADHLEAVVA
ncbi:glycosyltransferase [Kibdelosporangium persicum]|uniref:Zeaxanthin glucosyl transferase n=1 Tax=Kibdelosporangium persicum TaxID=2698649 RepID=A0ABX2F8H1_9PSEU|nr:nucleotide disphospho-sugar-binding domain-containing protein [Kibdelosporangium persicum]NRN67602.1 Zeaxanthin glucosyl transferase [Kibdelosporangium persicum]